MKKYLILISIVVLIITSCENTYIAYHKAKDKNTIEAYEKFIEKYPKSKYVDSANAEITFLTTGEYPIVEEEILVTESDITADEEDYAIWTLVSEEDDQEGYEEYLLLYPEGFYADSAEIVLYYMNKTLELKFENESDDEYILETMTLVFGEDDEITGTISGMKEDENISTWEGEIEGKREGMFLTINYTQTTLNDEVVEDVSEEELIFSLDNGGILNGEDFYEVITEDFIPLEVDDEIN